MSEGMPPGRDRGSVEDATVQWPEGLLGRARGLMATARFDDVLELAEQGAQRARRDGEHGNWRRFTVLRGTALTNLGRFEQAVEVCDDVLASAAEDDDLEVMAEAYNVSTVAADRLSREDDALRRLDGALAIGEQLVQEEARRDVLFKAACSAGGIGLAELGETVFSLVLDTSAPVAGNTLSPGYLIWIKANRVMVRCQWAVTLEHEGDPGSAARYEGTVELCHQVFAEMPDPSFMPAKPAAVFRAYEGFALTALGRHAEAADVLAAAAAVLPAEPFEMLTGSVDLLCGISALRTAPVGNRDEVVASTGRLVDLARRCREQRMEAEVWRLASVAAAGAGDEVQSSLARERFEALVERLDWRRRMQGAKLLGFRSQTLGRIAEGAGWLPPTGDAAR